MSLQEILKRFDNVKKRGDQFSAKCPCHDDKTNSLHIKSTEDEEEKTLLNCKAGCPIEDIVAAVGLKMSDLFPKRKRENTKSRPIIKEKYAYTDCDGNLVFQVVRYEPKDFRQRRPDPSNLGKWKWDLKGIKRPLYNLPAVLAKMGEGGGILVVEGEKDVHSLARIGIVATTTAGGANSKWEPAYTEILNKAKHVGVIPDNDDPGRKRAREVVKLLDNAFLLELPGLSPKGDVSDWIEAGGTREQLNKLAGEAHKIHVNESNSDTETPNTPDADGPRFIELPEPLRLAEDFLRHKYVEGDALTLRRWRGEWWFFDGIAYRHLSGEELDAQLYSHIDTINTPMRNRKGEAMLDEATGEPRMEKVTANIRRVNEVERAMAASRTLVDGTSPQWLDAAVGLGAPQDLLLVENGILSLKTMTLHPATPLYFHTNPLPVAFHEDAPQPERWWSFLRDIWGDDDESIETLQEWFGYNLVPDTRQQKALMLIGPKRSGKGTIARVLEALLGDDNVAGPTLSSLGTNFGLQSLLNKTLAIIHDARLDRRTDQAQIMERLLSITGEDRLTVARKYLTSVTLQLPTRIMLLTNELPRMIDSSGALASRFIMLSMSKSFFDKEDIHLSEHLIGELPGILAWGITGLNRLKERGRFIQPNAGIEALRDLEDLSSPVTVFVRERCGIGPKESVYTSQLFDEYKSWRGDSGLSHPCSKQVFGKDLRAAFPWMRISSPRSAGKRMRVYEGIGLAESC